MSVVRTGRVPQRAQLLIELIPRTALITFATIVGAAALTAVAAQLSFPVHGSPVPVTAQTLVVLVGAAALGPGRALVSQLLYIAAGAAGLPVFADHMSGISGVDRRERWLSRWFPAGLGPDRRGLPERRRPQHDPRARCVHRRLHSRLRVRRRAPDGSIRHELFDGAVTGCSSVPDRGRGQGAIASGVLPTTWRLLGRVGR